MAGQAQKSLMPLRHLLTEEQERYSEIQEWACSIFTAPGKQKKAKAKAKAAPAETNSWPSAEQLTGTLAQELDANPLRRRATHALRSGIQAALNWAVWQCTAAQETDGQLVSGSSKGTGAVANRAAQLANAAVLAHAPTSVLRSLSVRVQHNAGLWIALRKGWLSGRVALSAPTDTVDAYGHAVEPLLSKTDRVDWKTWLSEVSGVKVEEEGASSLAVADLLGQEGTRDPAFEAEPAPAVVLWGPESLRPYQKEALEAVQDASPANCCIVLPCGAGKTKTGASLAYEFLGSWPRGCVLVLCLRREGARQWAQELSKAWGICAVDVQSAGCRKNPNLIRGAHVILMTYHRMLSDRRRALARVAQGSSGLANAGPAPSELSVSARLLTADAGLLIADECHMVPAPRIHELLTSLLGPQRRLVGLTGTLLRESSELGSALNDNVPWPLLGNCVYRQTFAELAPEYLAPVRCVEVLVPVLGKWRSLFAKQPLAAAVCLSRGKWMVLEHLLARHAEESLLITVERCEQARLIASTFGIIPLDGSVSALQMKDYLERFRTRRILALVATHVLDDSADFPELTVMIQMAGHFASRRQEQQRLGRLLRWGAVKRRRWAELGTRPTFYCLVHGGTIEEGMSRRRTSSVTGVEYERLSAAQVMSPPESLIAGSDLFQESVAIGSQEREHADATIAMHRAAAASATTKMDEMCFSLSMRVAQSMPGSTTSTDQARLEDVRQWLRGADVKLRSEQQLEDQCSSSSEESWEDGAYQGSIECGQEDDEKGIFPGSNSSSGSSSSSSSSSSSTSSSSRSKARYLQTTRQAPSGASHTRGVKRSGGCEGSASHPKRWQRHALSETARCRKAVLADGQETDAVGASATSSSVALLATVSGEGNSAPGTGNGEVSCQSIAGGVAETCSQTDIVGHAGDAVHVQGHTLKMAEGPHATDVNVCETQIAIAGQCIGTPTKRASTFAHLKNGTGSATLLLDLD